MRTAKIRVASALVLVAAFAIVAASGSRRLSIQQDQRQAPQYTEDNKLVMPKDYREWIYLSSGLGMSYGASSSGMEPMFDNVFVNPAAYRSFLQNGMWPEKTVFALEVRAAASKGSINKSGHFQTDVEGIEAEVKDSSRPTGKWTFYGFRPGSDAGAPFPTSAACYSCHRDNTAVDNTFVQFYPTLIPIAKEKGTFRKTSEN
jgi:hypothetical protein